LPTTKSRNGKQAGSHTPASTLVTIEDVQRIGTFFKEFLERTHLKKWVLLAGVGGICEVLRVIWDVTSFLLKR
jgi:hypothetical protein